MPTRINGIGTWYWGKNNILARNANCEFCGTYRQLTSFDTTLYFTFLFVPLIPLQRKRVVDQCPGCRRHRAISLTKWEQQKSESLLTALQDWQADRANADKAQKAVGVTIAYHDRQAFEDLSPTMSQAFARDPSMQRFLADAHDRFGQREGAENCYRAAVALGNDSTSRRALATFLIRQLRPDEAQPLLQDVLATKDRAASKLTLALAQAYQAKGDHESAARIVDDVGTAFPDLLSNAEYDRIRRTSQKYRGTNKAVKAPGFDPARRGGALQASWFQRNGAKAFIGLILAVAIIAYVGMALSEGSHTVFIVNGTTVPYVALINGQPHNVRARDNVALDLDEGSFTVSVQNHPEIEPATVIIRTNFWKRPFDRRTFVINPDRTAMMYARKVEYSAHPSAHPEGDDELEIYVGDVSYNVKKPDDAFTEPPSSVDLSSDSAVVTRRALEMFSKLSLGAMIRIVQQQRGPDAAREWMKRRAATSIDDAITLELLARLSAESKPQEMIAFLRPHLADRPVRVDWHRQYQELMEQQHPSYDLVADYRASLAQAPEDPTLTYLLARTLNDKKEARSLFEKAAAANPPCAYACYALAYDDVCEMDFAKAEANISKARGVAPDNMQFIWAESEALEALGRLDAVIALVRSQQKHAGQDLSYVDEEVRLLVAKGDAAAAQQRIDLYCKELEGLEGKRENIAEVRNALDAIYAYGRGDMPAFKAAAKRVKGDEAAIELALIDGDYAAAESAINATRPTSRESYLMLCALAGANGDKAVADRAWEKVKTLLAKGNRDERKLAAALASSSADASDASFDRHGLPPNERPFLLVCIAQRYPQVRQTMLADATKLNFNTQFPHLQLADAIAKSK